MVFLASVVAYGVLTTGLGFRLGAAGLGAGAAVGRAECNSSGEGAIFTGSPWAVLIGTSSFVIALMSWIRGWGRIMSSKD